MLYEGQSCLCVTWNVVCLTLDDRRQDDTDVMTSPDVISCPHKAICFLKLFNIAVKVYTLLVEHMFTPNCTWNLACAVMSGQQWYVSVLKLQLWGLCQLKVNLEKWQRKKQESGVVHYNVIFSIQFPMIPGPHVIVSLLKPIPFGELVS